MNNTTEDLRSQEVEVKKTRFPFWLWALVPTAMSGQMLLPLTAWGQAITPDGTLPTQVMQDGDNYTIEGGGRAGGNLFHSFQEFSVPTGGEAYFDNAVDVDNIFSRVTGGNVSNIDGLIRANGSANLFLINPAGIVFGPNARLNIGGSFLGSSASSLMFPGGIEFSATDTQSTPLLTINAPIGLGFRENPGRIVVQGQLQNLVGGIEDLLPPQETPSIRPNERIAPIDPEEIAQPVIDSIESLANLIINIPDLGLGVKAGKTLALVGGEVALEGGQLRASQGRVELGSVGSNNQVSITPTDRGWALGYEGVENFQDVSISGLALVDVSGAGSGEVQVRGADVTIAESSSILAATQGNINGGEIFIGAEQLNIQENSLVGGVATEGSSGNSGKVTIETESLNIENSVVLSIGLSQGDSGDLTVKAEAGSVELRGTLADGLLPAGLTAATAGDGSGGTLMVETGQLIARDGAQVSATTGGNGQGGTVEVIASDFIELIGESANRQFESGVFAASFGPGEAGNVRVETGRLTIRDGGSVSASTRRGKGGSVDVTAWDLIEVSGTTIDGQFESSLATLAIGIGGEGENLDDNLQGGDLRINTRRLIVRDGAQISASSVGGIGQGGTVEVIASESIELIGQSADGRFKSGLLAQAILFPEPFDNIDKPRVAGNLRISTGELIVRDGAEINVSGEGLGAPGNITVIARSIHLDREGGVTAENISREGGNIELNISDSLNLQNNSRVSTSTSDGVGGTLSIKTPNSVIIDSESRLLSEATGDGTAGSLEIITNQLRVQADSSVAVSSAGTGDAGNLNIDAGSISLDSSNIRAETTSGGGADIQLTSGGAIALGNNSAVSATTEDGEAGTVTVSAPNSVIIDSSELTTEATGNGSAGNLRVTTNQFTVRDSEVTVSSASTGTGSAGNLIVDTGEISLDNGTLNANTGSGNQGNIILGEPPEDTQITRIGVLPNFQFDLRNVELRNDSEITANATDDATGGNIIISTDFLIAFPEGDNDIRANAQRGQGGQVEINADGVLGIDFRERPNSSSNDITARSEFGPQGDVTFNTPNADIIQGLVELSENVVDPNEIVAQTCSPNRSGGSSLIETGRGGLPPTPYDPLTDDTIRVGGEVAPPRLADLPDPEQIVTKVERTEEITSDDIQPARGWFVNEKGNIVLTPYPTPNATGRHPGARPACGPGSSQK